MVSAASTPGPSVSPANSGPTASPTKQPGVDVLPPPDTKCADVKTWFEANYPDSVAASPKGAIPELKIVSWMQVPMLLEQLKARKGEPIKLDFPELNPKDPRVLQEQNAIKEFLIKQAGSEIKNLPAALKTELENCAWFKGKTDAFTAEDYLKGFNITPKGSPKLTVAEVIRPTDRAFEPTKKGFPSMAAPAKKERELVLSAVEDAAPKTNQFYTVVIEVAKSQEGLLAGYFKKSIDSKPLDPAHVANIRVWVSPDPVFNPRNNLEEVELLAFLNRATPINTPPPRKKSNTTSAGQQIVVGAQP